MPLVNQFYFIGITQPWSVILPSPHVIYALVITFASLFYLKHTHYPMLLIVLILASLGANLAFLATHTMWFYHTLPAVGFAAILISLITAEATSPVTFRASAPFIVTSFFILYFPLQFTWFLSFSHALKEENKSKQTLIRLLAAQPGNHSVMCFSASTIADCFPLVTLTNSAYASRYPFFWWMRGALKLGDDTHAQPAINQLISSVADDLNHYRSRWIIINKTTMRNQFGENFSFLTFFSLNQQFKQAISAYRYWQSTGDYDIYERSQEK